jgi:hypothetical protein
LDVSIGAQRGQVLPQVAGDGQTTGAPVVAGADDQVSRSRGEPALILAERQVIPDRGAADQSVTGSQACREFQPDDVGTGRRRGKVEEVTTSPPSRLCKSPAPAGLRLTQVRNGCSIISIVFY